MTRPGLAWLLIAALSLGLTACSKAPPPAAPVAGTPTAPTTPATPAQSETKPLLTLAGTWSEGVDSTLTVSGVSSFPSVWVAMKQGGQIKREELVPVKDGRYSIDLGSATQSEIVAGGPDKKALRRIVVPNEKHAGPFFFAHLTPHLQDVWTRQVAPEVVSIEGKAVGFAGKFKVELRKDGNVLATGELEASQEAPALGRFMTTIQVPAGIPEGTEARYLLPVGENGSLELEYVVTVGPGK